MTRLQHLDGHHDPRSRPRVLTVLPDFPFPATTGLHLRMVGNLEALARLDVESHVLWFSTPDRSPGVIDTSQLDALVATHHHAGARVEQHEMSTVSKALSKFRFAAVAALGWPRSMFPYSMRYDAADAGAITARVAAELDVDAVVLPSQGMHWMDALPASIHVIVDAADVLTDVTARLARTHDGSWVKRLGLWANHHACKTQERLYVPRADEIWATTAAEADRFSELARGANPLVVPNTVPDVGDRPVRRSTPARGRRFGMLATWSYRPNLDAALRLVDGIGSRVLAHDPDARLVLAGADLPDELARRCVDHPRIDHLGQLDDVDDFYSAVDVVAIPLTVRGGVPLKLAEAFAVGRPVVASPELVDGLDLEHGSDLLVAETDERFAASIERLLGDESLQLHLAANGRAAQRRCFSVDRIEAALSESSILCR